ncbi:hypothetical protein [Gemmatimonas sp.]|uniref:hypothetical protein n=1 Tax=Gemmatimonas sp. TaxID=1962908 RepID=UPI002637C5DF|nr:hypothetical protein [Gemmatimonas sp.]
MNSQFENIQARIWKLLQRTPAMPLLGIQYRLCEVGTNRIGHLHMSLAIERLLADGAMVEPLAGVFVNSLEIAQRLGGDIAEVSRVWINRQPREHESAVTIVAKQICEQLDGFGITNGGERQIGQVGSNERLLAVRSRYVDVNAPRLSATLWISWTEQAICPSQSSFWAFLEECSNRGRVPMIVARAVSKLAFPVLKAMSARAVQYYFVPTPLEGEDLLDLQEAAGRFGLPAVRPAYEWGELPVVDALRTQLDALSIAEPPVERVRQALHAAVTRGFSKHQVRPTMLRRWANDIDRQLGIKLPRQWRYALRA